MTTLSPQDRAKIAAGEYAATLVEDGQIVGLGSGTSAWFFIRALAKRVDEGLKITGVPASTTSRDLANELHIPIVDMDDVDGIDMCIDGADEITPNGDMIKGGGANLLWEKVIATGSARVITVVDTSKAVEHLGAFPLPIEVVPFSYDTTRRSILALADKLGYPGVEASMRMKDGELLVTDNGNYIVDLHLRTISDPHALCELNQIPGVVENGLFLGICQAVVFGHEDGSATYLDTPFKLEDIG